MNEIKVAKILTSLEIKFT